MSRFGRDTANSSDCSCREGHWLFVQLIVLFVSSSGSTGWLHIGHVVGMGIGVLFSGLLITATTCGMILLAFSMIMIEPTRMSFSVSSEKLCSEAFEMSEPSSFTGANSATGVNRPVLPTVMLIFSTTVCACSVGYFHAIWLAG